MFDSKTVKYQKKVYGWKEYTEDGTKYRIKAVVRWDDECGNGHNSFSITGTIDEKSKNGRWIDCSGGCIHEEIAKHFPDLAPFIKWHLCDADGPMHYIANTMYLAGDRDCWGRRKGEPYDFKAAFNKIPFTTISEPTSLGEGKEPELDAARRAAMWPDATLEQLTSKEALEAHLAEIMPQFKRDVEALGFIW